MRNSINIDGRHPKRIGYLDGNTRGCCEIYFETENNKDAELIARTIQGTPAPIRGILMNESFEEIISSPNFKMMGGKILEVNKDE